MNYLFAAFITIGAVFIGGFIGRLSYALPRGEGREVWDPTCPCCGERYGAKFLIPIVGFFIADGRCPRCKEHIVPRALASEIALGVSALLLFVKYGFSLLFLSYVTVAAMLLLLSLIDLDIKEVPHSILFGVFLFGVLFLALSIASYPLVSLKWHEQVFGAFTISVPLFVVMMATGGGVGGGDVKLMFALGFLLGYKLVLVAFLAGMVFAAIFALVLVIKFGKTRSFALPLVPFLSLGFLFAVTLGDRVSELLFFASL